MRYFLATIFVCCAFSAHAEWAEPFGNFGFVPATISDASVGAVPQVINLTQNFSPQKFSFLFSDLPPGELAFFPAFFARVSTSGLIGPEPEEHPFNGLVQLSFKGKISLLNNDVFVGHTNFEVFTGFRDCVRDCVTETIEHIGGPQTVVDTSKPFNLEILFSDLVGTFFFNESSGNTSFLHLTAQYDIRGLPGFDFQPAEPVAQVPLPGALLLFLSAIGLFGIFRTRHHTAI